MTFSNFCSIIMVYKVGNKKSKLSPTHDWLHTNKLNRSFLDTVIDSCILLLENCTLQ